jgi:hypothetical protein
MLWNYSYYILMGIIWVDLLIVIPSIVVAYVVNARRSDDDIKRRKYPVLALVLAPFTWPLSFLFLGLALVVLLVRALLFALFLTVFIPSLILFRRPEQPLLLEKMAVWIGEYLLKINTRLLRLAIEPWAKKSQPA